MEITPNTQQWKLQVTRNCTWLIIDGRQCHGVQCPFEMICKKHNGEPKMFDAVVNEAEGRLMLELAPKQKNKWKLKIAPIWNEFWGIFSAHHRRDHLSSSNYTDFRNGLENKNQMLNYKKMFGRLMRKIQRKNMPASHSQAALPWPLRLFLHKSETAK